MLFYEGVFVLFLAVVGIVYLAVPSVRARRWLLLAASYGFYAAWDYRYLALILGSTVVDFYLARRMPLVAKSRARQLLAASVVVNLGTLAVFKYLDFAIGTFNAVAGTEWNLIGLTLPVGISFFTFQSMSYTIDVYRGRLSPEPRFVDFAVFVAFFPQLVAGPIIRASDFLSQLTTALRRFPHDVHVVLPQFVRGLFKKVVVADQLALVVDPVFANPQDYDAAALALAALAFAGQIYGDFSAYTDMALALCRLFGFQFPDNFRSPYLATGPQEFWRRWHISLSTWLRDYLYIPLGGSRHGAARTSAALLGTMLLGGLWHGASWTFVLWGAYHGVLLVIARFVRWPQARFGDVLAWPLFFSLTLLGWIIFRSESIDTLVAYTGGLTRFAATWPDWMPTVLWASGYLAVEQLLGEARRRGIARTSWLVDAVVAGLLLALVMVLRPLTLAPFIYFQF